MKGRLIWFRFYLGDRTNVPWKVFQLDVINRFDNPDNKDVQDLFNKRKQLGTVNDYEDKFVELRALISTKHRHFTEEYYVSSFISGLKDHIKGAVKMFRPQTLTDTIYLAKQEEAKTNKIVYNQPKPLSKVTTTNLHEPKVSNQSSWTSNSRHRLRST